MRTRLSSARSWSFAIGARLGRFAQLGAVLVLVFTVAACADRETADVVEEEGEAMDEQMEEPMGAAPGAEAANAVTVSITGSEIMLPASLPAGMTTLTIRNSSDVPCTFTMVSGDRGDMEGMEPSPDAAGDDMMQDGESVNVEAGQTAELSLTLQPGTYVAECDEAGAADDPTQAQRSAQVTVTDAGAAPGAAPGAPPQDDMNPQDGAEPQGQ